MSASILSVRNLYKAFGGLVATNDFSMEIAKNEVHAIIGPNGAGKSTLIAQVSGLLRPDRGSIVLEGRDVTRQSAASRALAGLARVFQISSIFREFTVYENMLIAVQRREGNAFKFWRAVRDDVQLRKSSMEILDQMGLTDRADVVASNLAYGEQRRLELGMAIAGRPTVLLLDEPMAGMGPEEADYVTSLLLKLRGTYTMLLVEHDMDAVFRLSDRVTVMVYGQAIASGPPAEIRANAQVRRAYLGEEKTVDADA